MPNQYFCTVKILVIRFSSIGDIVLTSPIVRCLKYQLNVEVHFVTKLAYKSLISFNPNIAKIHLLEKDLGKLIRELKTEKFDLIVDLHNNLRSNLIRRKLGVKAIAFNKINIEKALMVQFKWNRLPNKHLIDRYFDSLKSLGVKNDGKGLDFYLENSVPSIWERLQTQIVNSDKLIALILGGTYFTKKLPKEKWLRIIEQTDENLMLIGGKEDVNVANWLTDKTSKKIINTVGLTNVQESAFLLSKCDVVITGDTGMMHIAAALRMPIISIWGNTIPEFGMFPYYGENIVKNIQMEVPDLTCRPCSKLGKSSCPKKHFRCMVDQNTDMIVKNIDLIYSE